MKTDDIWDEFFGEDFKHLNQRIESMFSEIDNLRDPNIRTYGYTMYQGPDGIPHYHEFGNAIEEYRLEASTVEPFSDIVTEDDDLRVTLEVPGVKKQDISLECTVNSLSVKAQTQRKKFNKILALPCDIEPDSAHAVYNNGILEVTFHIAGKKDFKKNIRIE